MKSAFLLTEFVNKTFLSLPRKLGSPFAYTGHQHTGPVLVNDMCI